MSSLFSRWRMAVVRAALVVTAAAQAPLNTDSGYPVALVESGRPLFQQHCAFCHGRDAGGGETGPDLIDSP